MAVTLRRATIRITRQNLIMSTGPSIKTNTDFRVVCLTGAALEKVISPMTKTCLESHYHTSILRSYHEFEATTNMQEG